MIRISVFVTQNCFFTGTKTANSVKKSIFTSCFRLFVPKIEEGRKLHFGDRKCLFLPFFSSGSYNRGRKLVLISLTLHSSLRMQYFKVKAL